jgi:hypothetical protein
LISTVLFHGYRYCRTAAAAREILTLAAAVVLGAIMTILDAAIVNVALPTLGRDFNTSISLLPALLLSRSVRAVRQPASR